MTLFQRKGLSARNTHVKYESFITNHSKVMANVKLYADKWTNSQGKNYMQIRSIQNPLSDFGYTAGLVLFNPLPNDKLFACPN